MILVFLPVAPCDINAEKIGGEPLCQKYVELVTKAVKECLSSANLDETRIFVFVDAKSPQPSEQTFNFVRDLVTEKGFPRKYVSRTDSIPRSSTGMEAIVMDTNGPVSLHSLS